MMGKIIKPPSGIRTETAHEARSVFLAGSIEMGLAPDWQNDVAVRLIGGGFNVFNPRRDDWDPTWEQSVDNTEFVDQVLWEIRGIELADYVLFYFMGGTKAPITLLELGMVSQTKPDMTLVVCDDDYWRRGNVDVMCARFMMRPYRTLDHAIDHLLE
jgi:hypothetical protein